jgi:CDGSH-type Zn-finger protein
VKFEATESKKAWFCACKHTAHQPMCDGTHKSL